MAPNPITERGATAFVLSANIHRRNLSAGQKAFPSNASPSLGVRRLVNSVLDAVERSV